MICLSVLELGTVWLWIIAQSTLKFVNLKKISQRLLPLGPLKNTRPLESESQHSGHQVCQMARECLFDSLFSMYELRACSNFVRVRKNTVTNFLTEMPYTPTSFSRRTRRSFSVMQIKTIKSSSQCMQNLIFASTQRF